MPESRPSDTPEAARAPDRQHHTVHDPGPRMMGPEETASRLPYGALADAIRGVALARTSGELQAPPRLVLPLANEGVLLVMPAADPKISLTKLVTVHPANAGRGLPTIQGEVIVMDATTGTRLGVLDGAVTTARRTAALSLLAARTLAAHPRGPLLVVGAGTQGRSHLEAFVEDLGVSRVFVTSRSPESARNLAAHARGLGVDAAAVDAPEEVLGEVRLVVTATTSREPVLPEGVSEGTFVAAVGSFEPGAAEVPPALVARSRIVVDTLEGAREEAGDLIQAEKARAFRWSEATELEAVLREEDLREEDLREDIRRRGSVVFKSVGHALWDLAAARTAFPGS